MMLRRILLATIILCCGLGVVAQDSVSDCPPEGTAKRARVQELNTLKNRNAVPDSALVRSVTIDQLLQALPPGRGDLRTTDAVQLTAYVADVRIGPPESCNCMASDHWRRDTHIELTLQPMTAGDKSKLVVAEVTPRFREYMKSKGIDWSQRGLRDAFLGRWVRLTGWLFFDEMHEDESASGGDGDHIWRGTAWEIHPVTDMVVVNGPNAATSPTPQVGVSAQCRAVTAKGTRCSRRTTDPAGLCWQHR